MLLNALNVKNEYGIQTVLDIEKLEIRDGDRLDSSDATGRKSTLLGVLSGRIACDEGVVNGIVPLLRSSRPGKQRMNPRPGF